MEKIKSTKTEIQKAESSTIEIQQQCIEVVNEIQKRTESLESPLSSDQCCIYRVPNYLRKSKEEHYTPQVISMGPFHHDAYNVKLKTMEQRKLRYLKYFIRRVEDLQISLEKLVSTIKEYEESIRHCYAETIQLKSGPFVEIILVDAIFILELFWRYHFNDWASEGNGASLEPWLITAIRFDLILLENQLPFFILEKLFDLAFASHKHYTPQVISIGPFHHDANDKLHTMEQRKLRYLKYFIERVENFDISLEDLVRIIKENEESIRCCYAETIHLDSDHFVKIITMDAIFILELFWRDYFNDWTSEDNGACIETWLMGAIRFDLILLENQLPFFILEKLFDHAFASHPSYSKSLIQVMTFYYFDYYNTQHISYSPHLKMKHFLDLLRTFWLPPSEKIPKRGNDVVKHLHSATQLLEAGLEFKKDPSSCLLDIKFTKGALRMPPLTLDNSSETIIRNLLALEQCHCSDKAYITDYFILFGFLINTNKDVNLLVRKGVMLNLLGNSDEARNLVNSLVENVIYVDMNSDFYRVCKELKAFYKRPWNRWQATLRRDYFSSPWSIASTVVAFIFLVLALLQTIYTIKE